MASRIVKDLYQVAFKGLLFINVIANECEAIPGPDPWPRPGMQGLSSMDYTPEVLQLLYSVAAKSRQGRLICHA